MTVTNNLRRRYRFTLLLAGLVVVFQLVAIGAQLAGHAATEHLAIDHLTDRVSLDSAYLDVGNELLNMPINQSAVQRYLSRLNSALYNNDYPLMVVSIQSVNFNGEIPTQFTRRSTLSLNTAEQQIAMQVATTSRLSVMEFSPLALLAALLALPIYTRVWLRQKKRDQTDSPDIAPPQPKLVINLLTKSLGNNVTDTAVVLQNKPLCFYTALVRYCIEHPEQPLQHHKDIPDELVAGANRIFSRLIELGHTKRKRPDFNANLDKTLSEVRAALDEVFSEFASDKTRYYPPRAQGEGSRSKQHSFALTTLTDEDVEIIGN
ncbi:hypothetical protein OCL06_03690 [Alteromonas sp. ASW11-19]|uniref:Uncharacterized protein n=1 Tax=Alteromonas salexigens TaxID=2982530 RepID=A0ABT2VKA4_9ALTE|nr:hypothetical protein [Alteromonas salexigens]MCU7553698.1 hypothetical protein [Alteromonas salexigens]